MTEREARNKIVGIFTGWAGKKEADESHKSIIDLYNDYRCNGGGINIPLDDVVGNRGCSRNNDADNLNQGGIGVSQQLESRNQWLARTVVAAVITSLVGVIFCFVKLGMGNNDADNLNQGGIGVSQCATYSNDYR